MTVCWSQNLNPVQVTQRPYRGRMHGLTPVSANDGPASIGVRSSAPNGIPPTLIGMRQRRATTSTMASCQRAIFARSFIAAPRAPVRCGCSIMELNPTALLLPCRRQTRSPHVPASRASSPPHGRASSGTALGQRGSAAAPSSLLNRAVAEWVLHHRVAQFTRAALAPVALMAGMHPVPMQNAAARRAFRR